MQLPVGGIFDHRRKQPALLKDFRQPVLLLFGQRGQIQFISKISGHRHIPTHFQGCDTPYLVVGHGGNMGAHRTSRIDDARSILNA
jgi:hypothetical protein